MVAELELNEAITERWLEYTFLKEEVYNNLAAEIAADTSYYDMTHQMRLVPPDWKKEGVPEVWPPTAYDAVENASDHILTTPRVGIPSRPVQGGDRHEQDSVEVKRDATRLFWQNVERQGDPVGMGKKKLVKDGILVFKKLIRWEDVPDEPATEPLGMARFPWTVEALPGETVMPDPDEWWDSPFIYERYLVRVAKAKRRFPEAEGAWRMEKPGKQVEVVEYWSKPMGSDKGKHIIWIESEPVQSTINPYHYETDRHTKDAPDYDGYVPYVIRPSGWGERTADGAPEKLFVGLIRRAHSVMDAEAMQITGANAQMLLGTYPIIKLINIPETKRVRLGPGIGIPLDEGQDIVPVQMPQVPQATFEIINRMQEYINDLTKFRTLGGVPLKGIDTATEADQTFRAASSKLSGPLAAMTSAMEELSRQFLLDIDKIIGLPIILYGDTGVTQEIILTPADIDGFHRVNIELTTTDQETLSRADARLWGDLNVRVEGLSEETVMEGMGIPDPAREVRQKEKEVLFRSPEQRQLRSVAAMAVMGPAAAPIRAAFMARIAAEIQGGSPGAPAGTMGGDDVGSAGSVQQRAVQGSREKRPDRENQ